MTHDEAFLAAICERPDDDTPRLIYADWLDDHGQPERAEFIRVQVELARLPREEEWVTGRRVPRRDSRWARLRRREQQLEDAHSEDWLRHLPRPPGVSWRQFERGFAAEVVAEVGALEQHQATIFKASPVTAVRLRGRPSAFDVAEATSLAWVRFLAVTFDRLDAGGIAALNNSPHLDRLQLLDLGRLDDTEVLAGTPPLGREGLRVIAEADLTTSTPMPPPDVLPFLRCLTVLDLSLSRIQDCGAEVLARCRYLAGLTALDLSDNAIGVDGLRALASSPYLQSLRHLGLSGNAIEPAWGDILAASPFLTGLTSLTVSGADESDFGQLGDEGVTALVASPNCANLTRLNLSHSGVGDRGAEVVARRPHLANLTDLGLFRSRIGPEGAAALADSALLAGLTYLSLGGNRLGDSGAIALAAAPGATGLYFLDVGWGVGQAGAEALLRSPHLSGLCYLGAARLSCDPVTLAGLRQRFGNVSTDVDFTARFV
jgi:uncharacterized protein (TIGR02996 family)